MIVCPECTRDLAVVEPLRWSDWVEQDRPLDSPDRRAASVLLTCRPCTLFVELRIEQFRARVHEAA